MKANNLNDMLNKLASEVNDPCVTISLNTHRTHPDNTQDKALLKKLLKEAEVRISDQYGKKTSAPVLDKIKSLATEIDVNYNLDSLHIFLSKDTQEVIKSPWTSGTEGVYISDGFAVRPIIQMLNRNERYLVLLLSQGGVQLYEAKNDEILREIENEDFPIPENTHYNTHADKGSDSRYLDDLVREYLNEVDKALVKVHHEIGMHCVVICTEDNYSRLQQVADKPSIYIGYSAIDYNHTEPHQIIKQSWDMIKHQQKLRRSQAITEIKEAVSQGNVLTDLQEIFQASIDGRGDLLIVHEDFHQNVVMTSERTFTRTDDTSQSIITIDIAGKIAWEVLSKKGKVFFTEQDDIKDLGPIVLKTRY